MLLVFVGLACWLIWPSDPETSAPREHSSHDAIASRSYTWTATGPQPVLSTADGDAVALPETTDAERIRIEGVVIDEQKAPIGGATVSLGARTTTAEADGSFALDDVLAGDIILRAERGEWYGEESTYVSDTSDPIEITVRRGSTLVLHVVKVTDGQPIANAKVEIARRELFTNANGVIRTRGLDPTGERFTISADGFGTWRGDADFDIEKPTAEKEMTVKLANGAPVSGIVVDERGERVPEAYVSIIAVDNTWNDSVTADEHGEFTIPAIATGKHGISASSKLHLATPEQLITHDGVHPFTGIVVRVSLGAELVGRVVDSAGKPVAGASVHGASGADTDADGRFVATGLEPGEVTLSAYVDSRSSEETKVTVSTGKRTEVLLVVRDSSLAGRVVDTKGTPIADAMLWAKATDQSNTFFATADEYGKFDFGGMPPGDYVVIAQHDEEQNRRLPDDGSSVVHTGRRDLTIVLPRLATVVGRVVLDGAPVPYFGVTITKTPTKLHAEKVVPVADDTGAFAQKDIAAGTWSVVIVGPGFATKIVDGIVAAEARTTDLGTIVVERGRILRGRVTDASGRPVPDALVVVGTSLFSIANNRVDQRAQGDATARTDASGRYEIAGIASEDLKIVARANGATSVERALAPDETTADLVITDVGTVVGHIANMKGSQAGIALSLADEEATTYGPRYYGDVDRAGDFRVTAVPPGRYTIRVMGENTLPEKTVDVVGTKTVHVDFEMPVVQIKVTAHAKDCSLVYLVGGDVRSLSVCTNDDVSWDAVAPGSYRVCPSSGDDGCAAISVAASPATQRFEVRFASD